MSPFPVQFFGGMIGGWELIYIFTVTFTLLMLHHCYRHEQKGALVAWFLIILLIPCWGPFIYCGMRCIGLGRAAEEAGRLPRAFTDCHLFVLSVAAALLLGWLVWYNSAEAQFRHHFGAPMHAGVQHAELSGGRFLLRGDTAAIRAVETIVISPRGAGELLYNPGIMDRNGDDDWQRLRASGKPIYEAMRMIPGGSVSLYTDKETVVWISVSKW